MKASVTAVAAMAVASVYAQSASSTPAQTYTTTVYSDCPSVSLSSLITVTQGVTATYCPECEQSSSGYPAPPGYTTVYTTTYLSLCPTGVVPATYTVTESCTGATPLWTPGPSHIPNGFTVTTKQCTVCDITPVAVTITEPCGCEASNGVPISNGNPAPTPAPAPPKTTPGGGSGPGNGTPAPAAAPSACNGEECGGSGNQSPTGAPGGAPAGTAPGSSAGTPACNGEECGGSGDQSPSGPGGAVPNTQPSSGGSSAKPVPAVQSPPYPTSLVPMPSTGGTSSGSNRSSDNGSGTGITPSEGGASTFTHAGVITSVVLAVVVGAFAFGH